MAWRHRRKFHLLLVLTALNRQKMESAPLSVDSGHYEAGMEVLPDCWSHRPRPQHQPLGAQQSEFARPEPALRPNVLAEECSSAEFVERFADIDCHQMSLTSIGSAEGTPA